MTKDKEIQILREMIDIQRKHISLLEKKLAQVKASRTKGAQPKRLDHKSS